MKFSSHPSLPMWWQFLQSPSEQDNLGQSPFLHLPSVTVFDTLLFFINSCHWDTVRRLYTRSSDMSFYSSWMCNILYFSCKDLKLKTLNSWLPLTFTYVEFYHWDMVHWLIVIKKQNISGNTKSVFCIREAAIILLPLIIFHDYVPSSQC